MSALHAVESGLMGFVPSAVPVALFLHGCGSHEHDLRSTGGQPL